MTVCLAILLHSMPFIIGHIFVHAPTHALVLSTSVLPSHCSSCTTCAMLNSFFSLKPYLTVNTFVLICNKTANCVLNDALYTHLPRRSLPSDVLQFFGTLVIVITLNPARKRRPAKSRFPRNKRMLNCIVCRPLIPDFNQIVK